MGQQLPRHALPTRSYIHQLMVAGADVLLLDNDEVILCACALPYCGFSIEDNHFF